MIKKRVSALALTLALFWALMSGLASAVPGSPADPLVTLSYITEKFTPMITAETDKRAVDALNAANSQLNTLLSGKLSGLYNQRVEKTITPEFINAVNTKAPITNTVGRFRLVAAANGQTLKLARGSSVMLVSGDAKLDKFDGTDLTAGAEMTAGTALPLNHEVLFFDSGGSIVFNANSALLINGSYAFYVPAYIPKYNDLATALKAMGLLRGTGSGFNLGRPATRTEALYMMLYLLGEIGAAEAYTGTSPFTDVPQWASSAVAYAYEKGYTKGTGAERFGSEDKSTPAQYLTMLLRVMGYDDSSGDFSWDESAAFAVSAGILTAAEETALNSLFYRDQMVYVSYYALEGKTKGDASTLQQTLISRGVLTDDTVSAARSKINRVRGLQ